MDEGVHSNSHLRVGTSPWGTSNVPPPHEIKNFILNLDVPTIIRGGVSDWPLLKWNLSHWSDAVSGTKLPFRTGKRNCTKDPQWERKCGSIELTIDEFIKYSESEKWKDEWAYFDYKYMNQWFKDNTKILQSISWKNFGFPEVRGEDSTMWLGTPGAHTPCHSDSYSLNIVAQIYGRKMWIMFPPESTNKLRPTRVPYEESSVYSKINFYCGNSNYSKIDEAYFVVLEPGDVLVVPNQWWHYVENLSDAISVNTWIPLVDDDDKRLEECLVRNFITSSIKDLSMDEQNQILNPNEEMLLSGGEIDMDKLNFCVERCKQLAVSDKLKSTNLKSSHSSIDLDLYKSFQTVSILSMNEVIQFLRNKCKCSMTQAISDKCNEVQKSSLIVEDYINAFCNPDVIKEVKQKLLSNKNM